MYNIDMIRHANTSKMTQLFLKMLSFFLYLLFLTTSAYPIYRLHPAFGIQRLTSGKQQTLTCTPPDTAEYYMDKHGMAEYIPADSSFDFEML